MHMQSSTWDSLAHQCSYQTTTNLLTILYVHAAKVTIINKTTAVLTWTISGSIENIYRADIQNASSAPGTTPSVLSAFYSSEPISLKGGKLSSEALFFDPSEGYITTLLSEKKASFDVQTSKVI